MSLSSTELSSDDSGGFGRRGWGFRPAVGQEVLQRIVFRVPIAQSVQDVHQVSWFMNCGPNARLHQSGTGVEPIFIQPLLRSLILTSNSVISFSSRTIAAGSSGWRFSPASCCFLCCNWALYACNFFFSFLSKNHRPFCGNVFASSRYYTSNNEPRHLGVLRAAKLPAAPPWVTSPPKQPSRPERARHIAWRDKHPVAMHLSVEPSRSPRCPASRQVCVPYRRGREKP